MTLLLLFGQSESSSGVNANSDLWFRLWECAYDMSRSVKTGSVDQSLRLWVYDVDGTAITGEEFDSAGIEVSVVVRSNGRIVSTTPLTLVARSGIDTHTDSAFTEVGDGEYVVDLADTYSATAGRVVSVTFASDAMGAGHYISENLEVGQTVELDSDAKAEIVDLIYDEAMSGHTTSGTYGANLVRSLNSNNTVQITGSNHVASDVHAFQANVIDANALAASAVAEIQSGLATPAQVNAEIVDALSVDTYAELSSPPAATSSLKDKITWLFMYARNKVTQTSLARTLYRDDTTTVAGTSATSDNGTTFTKGEDT